MSTIVQTINELQANQKGVAAVVKQLQDNLNVICKATMLVVGQKASTTQDGQTQKLNNGSFLTHTEVMKLLEKKLHKPTMEDLKCVSQPPLLMEIFERHIRQGYKSPHFTLFNGRKESLVDFIRRFKGLALECYDKHDEYPLVEIYVNNIVLEYHVYLENLAINPFTKLIEVARKTSLLVKVQAKS
ncbi:hypothetical protein FNV43_RR12461 [Rhamnella rubrinervis]|uniref:Uncharacterized protein n=1 Tax=Rhamnella rubrinervis TaxID=2594499 RepID=A0A8K0H7S2_9ROSA|nr:hypothetical protein FNV43_RR12461 [Rhamnella rubrinervis]